MLRRWSSLALLALAVVVSADRGGDDDTVVNMVERVSEMASDSGDRATSSWVSETRTGREVEVYRAALDGRWIWGLADLAADHPAENTYHRSTLRRHRSPEPMVCL
jgi:hypothetical protein